jgi:transposase
MGRDLSWEQGKRGKAPFWEDAQRQRLVATSPLPAAWAASRTKDTYLAAQYHRLIVRKGKKQTIVAVAHTLLVIAYYVAKRQRPYQELGGDYFDRINTDVMQRRLVKKLRNLGYEVTLTPLTPPPVAEEPIAEGQ